MGTGQMTRVACLIIYARRELFMVARLRTGYLDMVGSIRGFGKMLDKKDKGG